ncbi:ribonuclease H-like protein [Xylariaceae sp. FL1019]|nr:ribonuclease H-like protein [Xylariaceae sp. FL1019]
MPAHENELPSNDEFLAMFGMKIPERRRGTGRTLPTLYETHTGRPETDFVGRPGLLNDFMERFTHTRDASMLLLYVDGACTDNGQDGAKAAWAFQFGPEPEARTCSGRLETKGPFGGNAQRQTSNRAELRATLAALRARQWSDDGYRTVVIAADSEYVVSGATEWTRKWTKNNWKASHGGDVANRDLWELLLGEAERYQEEGLTIQFWRIGRDLNKVADAAAKKATAKPDDETFEDFMVPGI